MLFTLNEHLIFSQYSGAISSFTWIPDVGQNSVDPDQLASSTLFSEKGTEFLKTIVMGTVCLLCQIWDLVWMWELQ